jgi:hypothetical protein
MVVKIFVLMKEVEIFHIKFRSEKMNGLSTRKKNGNRRRIILKRFLRQIRCLGVTTFNMLGSG